MSVVVEGLGLALVKGLQWSQPTTAQVTSRGILGDRHWSPVTQDLVCIKATDFPEMVGVRASRDDLPAGDDALFDGQPQAVTYYTRTARARVYGGRLADRLSEAAGRRLLLAQASEPGHFLWSSPVSLLLRSQLGGFGLVWLGDDVGRYRANLVLDDRSEPLSLSVGTRLAVGSVVLEVERELERCVIINHHPASGERDVSLLGLLPPGLLLGYGCAVVHPGRINMGDSIRVA